MSDSMNREEEIRKWLDLTESKLFEKVSCRPSYSKKIRLEKPWKDRESKLIIG